MSVVRLLAVLLAIGLAGLGSHVLAGTANDDDDDDSGTAIELLDADSADRALDPYVGLD